MAATVTVKLTPEEFDSIRNFLRAHQDVLGTELTYVKTMISTPGGGQDQDAKERSFQLASDCRRIERLLKDTLT